MLCQVRLYYEWWLIRLAETKLKFCFQTRHVFLSEVKFCKRDPNTNKRCLCVCAALLTVEYKKKSTKSLSQKFAAN